jgi:hypothetical protein
VHVNRLLVDEVSDPDLAAPCPEREDDGSCPVRNCGDIIPDFALDRSDEHTRGNIYAVWMDTRFNDADHNDIVLDQRRHELEPSRPPVVDLGL